MSRPTSTDIDFNNLFQLLYYRFLQFLYHLKNFLNSIFLFFISNNYKYLVLIRVILGTAFQTKPKNNSELLDFSLQTAALIEEN